MGFFFKLQRFGVCLGHGWASEGGRSHLGQDAVQPLQRPIEVQLNPAWCGGDSLPTIFRTPPLDKTHADGATPRQLIDGLKALIHWLRKECCKLLVVEDLQVTARRNLTHLQLYKIWTLNGFSYTRTRKKGGYIYRSWMPSVSLVAIWWLHKNRWLGKTLCKDFSSNVVESYPFANMSAGLLNHWIAVDIREEAQAKPRNVYINLDHP